MKAPSAKEILAKTRFSKATSYDWQLCYDMPDGRTISVVHTCALFTRKDLEEMLVNAVQEAYAKIN